MDIAKFYDWENMALSKIIGLMVKWFNVESVEMEVTERPVESGVWWHIKFIRNGKTYYANGQRADIVRRRLIAELDRLEIRKDYLNKKL